MCYEFLKFNVLLGVDGTVDVDASSTVYGRGRATRLHQLHSSQFVCTRAMDVMLLLQHEALTSVYADFKVAADEKRRGLTLHEFVASILAHVPPERYGGQQHVITLVEHLVDIFRTIDVNGDANLEWGEFMAYCVEAGHAAAQRLPRATCTMYWDGRVGNFEAPLAKGLSVLSFCAGLNAIIAIETGSRIVRLLTPRLIGPPLGVLDCGLALSRELRETDASVAVSFAYAPPYRLLAVLLSTYAVVLWGLTDRGDWELRGTLPEARPSVARGAATTTAKVIWPAGSRASYSNAVVLTYEPHSRAFLLGCSDGAVLSYSADGCGKASIALPSAHMDIVLSLAPAPQQQLLVSSSLDGTVLLWDMVRGKVRRELNGARGAHVSRLRVCDEIGFAFGITGLGEVVGYDLNVGEVSSGWL